MERLSVGPTHSCAGSTAFRQCWWDCFQPHAWKAVGSFFLGYGLRLWQSSSRELLYTDLMTHRATMKQHGSLGHARLWEVTGQPGQALPLTLGAHEWARVLELCIIICKALRGFFKGTHRVFVCWGRLQTSSEPARAVLLAVMVFYNWYPGEMLSWGRRTEMSLKIESCN